MAECQAELDLVRECYRQQVASIDLLGCSQCSSQAVLPQPNSNPNNSCLAITTGVCNNLQGCANQCGACLAPVKTWSECVLKEVRGCRERQTPCDCVERRSQLDACILQTTQQQQEEQTAITIPTNPSDPSRPCRQCLANQVAALQIPFLEVCSTALPKLCSVADVSTDGDSNNSNIFSNSCASVCGSNCLLPARNWMGACPGVGLLRCRPFTCPPIIDLNITAFPTIAPISSTPTFSPIPSASTTAPTLTPSLMTNETNSNSTSIPSLSPATIAPTAPIMVPTISPTLPLFPSTATSAPTLPGGSDILDIPAPSVERTNLPTLEVSDRENGSDNRTGLSTAALLGIIASVVLLSVLCLLLLLCCCRRRKRTRRRRESNMKHPDALWSPSSARHEERLGSNNVHNSAAVPIPLHHQDASLTHVLYDDDDDDDSSDQHDPRTSALPAVPPPTWPDAASTSGSSAGSYSWEGDSDIHGSGRFTMVPSRSSSSHDKGGGSGDHKSGSDGDGSEDTGGGGNQEETGENVPLEADLFLLHQLQSEHDNQIEHEDESITSLSSSQHPHVSSSQASNTPPSDNSSTSERAAAAASDYEDSLSPEEENDYYDDDHDELSFDRSMASSPASSHSSSYDRYEHRHELSTIAEEDIPEGTITTVSRSASQQQTLQRQLQQNRSHNTSTSASDTGSSYYDDIEFDPSEATASYYPSVAPITANTTDGSNGRIHREQQQQQQYQHTTSTNHSHSNSHSEAVVYGNDITLDTNNMQPPGNNRRNMRNGDVGDHHTLT